MTAALRRVVGAALASLLLGACALDAGAQPADEPLVVAAASDLRPAFAVLGRSFEEATGEDVTFSFGSSGQLAQQLIEGAPMDLFASASAAYVDQVLAAGVGDPTTRSTYAFGRLALWARADSSAGWQDLRDLAADDAVPSIAIANPEHAPYGLAAEQALRSAGAWDTLSSALVFGENVADTQRLAASGNVDAALVALSLALAADEEGSAGPEGRWQLIDDRLHEPLRQDLLVVTDDPDRAARAQRFVDHVASDEGREVMRRFGLLLPDEEPPAGWER